MASISNSMLENFSMMLVAPFSLLNSRPHFQMFIGLLQFNVFQFLKFKETLKNHHLLYHPNLFLPICSLYPEMKLYCSNDLKLEIISNHFFFSLLYTSCICCCSVARLCLSLCHSIDCSMPVFPFFTIP